MSPTVIVIGVLMLLLALSGAGNAWLFHERDKALEAKATAVQLNADTAKAAETCGASVDKLATDSKVRHKNLEQAIGLTDIRVAELQGRANQVLQTKPDNPADLCGSLERFLRARIVEDRAGAAKQEQK